MSGVFDPAQQTGITATDDPGLAKQFGLTEWDEARGQFVAPAPDDNADSDADADAIFESEMSDNEDDEEERDDEDPVL